MTFVILAAAAAAMGIGLLAASRPEPRRIPIRVDETRVDKRSQPRR